MNIENAEKLIQFLKWEMTDLPQLPEPEEKETINERFAQYDEKYFFSLPVFIKHYFYEKKHCGTVCCIAGAVRVMELKEKANEYHFSNIVTEARDFLGINNSAANALFAPDLFKLTDGKYLKSDITRKHAIIVLNKMIWRHEEKPELLMDGDVIRRFWVDALKGIIS